MTAQVAAELDLEPVPFHRASLTEADIAAVVAVMRSGWLTSGEQCRAFEQAFAESLGGGVEALAVSSCTAALHLALEAIGIGPGDLVLTSPYTFTATAEVIRYLGAHPVFADVDPVTGNLTAATVSKAVLGVPSAHRRRIRALLPVHVAGLPCHMEELSALAEEHGWRLVDDAAHALPATRRGTAIGAWGDATAFSFYATKTLCTGEGGMLVTSDPEIAARARVMRLHGIDRDAFDRYRRADSWRYRVVAAGFKYNLTDMAAALGLSQLARLRSLAGARERIARQYAVLLEGVPGLALPEPAPEGDEHAWHLYAVRVLDGPVVRDEVIRALGRAGIGTSVHFIPLHLHPYYRDAYQLDPRDLPGATRLYGQELSLPIFPDMTEDQVCRVADGLRTALRAHPSS